METYIQSKHLFNNLLLYMNVLGERFIHIFDIGNGFVTVIKVSQTY